VAACGWDRARPSVTRDCMAQVSDLLGV